MSDTANFIPHGQLCEARVFFPDDPKADEEACTDCDRGFWENPVFIYVEVPNE